MEGLSIILIVSGAHLEHISLLQRRRDKDIDYLVQEKTAPNSEVLTCRRTPSIKFYKFKRKALTASYGLKSNFLLRRYMEERYGNME